MGTGAAAPIDARKEADAAWVVIQTECQRLLSELLGSGPLRTGLPSEPASGGPAGFWIQAQVSGGSWIRWILGSQGILSCC